MNKILVTSCALAALTISSGKFSVREKETDNSNKTEWCNTNNTCFDSFIANLKSLDAIIYIPDSKTTEAKSLGLVPAEKSKALVLNKNITTAPASYMQIIPSDTTSNCGNNNILNFKNLKMIVFVKTEKAASLKAMNLIKLEPASQMFKIESSAKITNMTSVSGGEKMKFKFENNNELIYTPFFKIT